MSDSEYYTLYSLRIPQNVMVIGPIHLESFSFLQNVVHSESECVHRLNKAVCPLPATWNVNTWVNLFIED